MSELARRSPLAHEIVSGAPPPHDLGAEIVDVYARLMQEYGPQLMVAVRGSATAEDLPRASFAGQHETLLNIAGEVTLLDEVRRCFSSLSKGRAINATCQSAREN